MAVDPPHRYIKLTEVRHDSVAEPDRRISASAVAFFSAREG